MGNNPISHHTMYVHKLTFHGKIVTGVCNQKDRNNQKQIRKIFFHFLDMVSLGISVLFFLLFNICYWMMAYGK